MNPRFRGYTKTNCLHQQRQEMLTAAYNCCLVYSGGLPGRVEWFFKKPIGHLACGGWLVAHQTSGAEVPGSNPASPTMILMRCRIIVIKYRKSQGRKGNLPLRQKNDFNKIIFNWTHKNKPDQQQCVHFFGKWQKSAQSLHPTARRPLLLPSGPCGCVEAQWYHDAKAFTPFSSDIIHKII